MGTLNTLFTEEISELSETKMLDLLKSKMKAGASMFVTAVRAIQKEYGSDGMNVIRKAFNDQIIEQSQELKTKGDSLKFFCSYIGTPGIHEWKMNENSDSIKSYCFTKCMWAAVFKELNAQDIGLWICDGDFIATKSFSSKIKLTRTKTLMEGHDSCNHTFYVEE